jgi:hypothetical protein
MRRAFILWLLRRPEHNPTPVIATLLPGSPDGITDGRILIKCGIERTV